MDRFSKTCERVASWAPPARKAAILAEYLDSLSPLDRARVERFLGPPSFKIGGTILRDAAISATGVDAGVWAACREAVGDTGETIALLLHNRTKNQPLSLAEAELLYARLSKMRTGGRVELLRHTFLCHRPATLKYFIRVLTGSLRIALPREQAEGITIDVVVTAAEQRSYTLGVRAGDEFVNVGKAYFELPEDEMRQLARVLRTATVERFGRVALVKPEVVFEVAFDGIETSSRRKGGFALRHPRILRWRRDKAPSDAATIERVRELVR